MKAWAVKIGKSYHACTDWTLRDISITRYKIVRVSITEIKPRKRKGENMNINRAGKQQKAYWRSEQHHQDKWIKEKPITEAEKQFGQHLRTCERVQGFATGWIAGVRWARRNRK